VATKGISLEIVRTSSLDTGVHQVLVVVEEGDAVVLGLGHAVLVVGQEAGGVAVALVAVALVADALAAVQGKADQEAEVNLIADLLQYWWISIDFRSLLFYKRSLFCCFSCKLSPPL